MDFGTLRVGDESKQACSLKNKGRYEIAFNFVFDNPDRSNINYNDFFIVSPSKGSLIPGDRPTQVQVIFKSKEETVIKEQQILKCQVEYYLLFLMMLIVLVVLSNVQRETIRFVEFLYIFGIYME